MKVAFLGLGAMGMDMAANLAKAGHAVVPWNRSRKTLAGFGDAPPPLAGSIAAAVRGAEAVISMLADDRAVEAVVADGLLEAMGPETVHVSMSSISVAAARRLAEAHAHCARAYVAAPVFGRPDLAASAKLWIAVAGDDASIARVRPLLQAMGRGVTELGPEPWHANLVKLGTNFAIASMLETFGEGCGLMRRAGIDPKRYVELVNDLFQSPVYASYGDMVAEGRYGPALFRAALGLKDMRLVLQAADEFGVPMPIASLAHDNLMTAVAKGPDDQDWTALARVAQERAGLD